MSERMELVSHHGWEAMKQSAFEASVVACSSAPKLDQSYKRAASLEMRSAEGIFTRNLQLIVKRVFDIAANVDRRAAMLPSPSATA